jgi:uncharacterized membrane protein
MKTFSEVTNISLLHEILKNNTDKKVDYDTVQYDGNKLRFKTRSQFDGGIQHEYIVITLVLTILVTLIPIMFITLSPTLNGVIIWGIIDILFIYFSSTVLMEHKPPFAILCVFLSISLFLLCFFNVLGHELNSSDPLKGALRLKEFYEIIPKWVYKFKF